MPIQLQATKKKHLLLLACALYVLFCCVVLVTYWWFEQIRAFQIFSFNHAAFYYESLALLLTCVVLILLSARTIWSFSLTCLWYWFLLLANQEKIATLSVPIMPRDALYFNELLHAKETLSSYWPVIAGLILGIFVLFWFYRSEKPNQMLQSVLFKTRTVAFVLLLVVVVFKSDINQYLLQNNFTKVAVNPNFKAQKIGYLSYFYRRLITFNPKPTPDNYNKKQIDELLKKYQPRPIEFNHKTPQPNVIIFFIEAFTDPVAHGLSFNRDPIPNFRRIKEQGYSGTLSSPVIGGLSANAEFELLTGFSMDFIAAGSIPYVDLIKHPLPSLASEFKQRGYATHALHVATLDFFNYKLVYPLIGFEHQHTLYGNQNHQKDPANRFPNESELVDEIIALTDNQQPQFIFSFPNSTHGFWDYDAYLESDLEITNWHGQHQADELKTYINALHAADQAIGQLIDHYRNSDEPTVILVAGDHFPGLHIYQWYAVVNRYLTAHPNTEFPHSSRDLRLLFRTVRKEHNELLKNTLSQVPYVLWSNQNTEPNTHDIEMYAVNHMIRSLVGITTAQPFYQLSSQLFEAIEQQQKQLIGSLMIDFELLQYDLLYGEKHYLEAVQINDE